MDVPSSLMTLALPLGLETFSFGTGHISRSLLSICFVLLSVSCISAFLSPSIELNFMDFTRSCNVITPDLHLDNLFCKEISVGFVVHVGLSPSLPELYYVHQIVLCLHMLKITHPASLSHDTLPSCFWWLIRVLSMKVTETPADTAHVFSLIGGS